MFNTIIALYAPHHCVGCQAEGTLLCASCTATLLVAASRCYRCKALTSDGRTCHKCRSHTKLSTVHVATLYRGAAKQLVGRLKFGGARSAASVIAAQLSQIPLPNDVLIVPVPTATSRRRLRGYDQAVLIAKQLASRKHADYLPCLLRIGQHRQVGATRAKRLLQMQDSFMLRDASSIAGRQVVLVDDVMTTGATLESVAALLKKHGARRVEAVVFARA